MSNSFNHYLQKKLAKNRLYDTGTSCGTCVYRNPWTNYCYKFGRQLKRIQQRNGGFHHHPCTECFNTGISNLDIKKMLEKHSKTRGK